MTDYPTGFLQDFFGNAEPDTLKMLTIVTLPVDTEILQKAIAKADQENPTLNALFVQWLREYISKPSIEEQYDMFMSGMSTVTVARKYDRDEMNERR